MSNTNSKSTKPQASDSDQMAVEKETLGDAPLEQHGQICDKTESSPDKHDKGNNTNLKHEGVEKNTKTQVDAPSNKANKDSWAERYGRALMSDRSGDHVGLPYFDGYPWEKAGPKSKAEEQQGEKHNEKDDKEGTKQQDDRGGDEETSTDPFNENVPPW